jgi:hypothetical protein
MKQVIRLIVGAHLSFALIVTIGCGSGGSFSTAQATGRVVCEGKGVEGAMVYFEPIKGSGKGSGKDGMVGKQGFSYTDAEGKFVISTYEPGGQDGAVIGKHRVRVGKGKSKCNCSMNDEEDLMEVEVKADVKNEFELVLKKATMADKAREKANKEDED